MLTIICDLQVTRRKRVNTVVQPNGEVLFSAAHIGDVLDWLKETEVTALNIETLTGNTYHLRLSPAKSIMKSYLESLAKTDD